MRQLSALLGRILLLGLYLFVAGALPGTARAGVGPADDRQLISQTGWWTYTGVSGSTLASLLTTNGARLTDLKVESAVGPTFTAVMVKNSGDYASGWWWYYGLTAAEVNTQLSQKSARLISAQAYSTSSGVRFAVVMVPNTGANAKGWWWYYGSASYIGTQLSNNKARLIQLTPYAGSNSTYVAIMVDNTGTNNTGWWWYIHVSGSQLGSNLSSNNARLVDISRNSDGTFNGVMYADNSKRWYWYYNSFLSTALARAGQQGTRVIADQPYYIGNTKYHALVQVRNTNTLGEKLWNIIGPKVDSGAYGFYMKQVGGLTLTGLLHNDQYEPASALKVLYHAKNIREQSLGNAKDTDTITYRYNPSEPNNGGICTDNFTQTKTTNLKNADQLMMWNSDNRTTRGILEKYGRAVTRSYGVSLGMTSTQINHNIGCPTSSTLNRTTLVDLGRVYEAFQNGTITTNTTWRAEFRSRMLNEGNTGYRNSICPVVRAEATSLGKSTTTATNFCNAMTWIAKGGSYQYGGSLPYTVSWDEVSLTGIPFKSGSTQVPRFYIFGEYVDGTQINSMSEANAINAARAKEYQEAMRPYIRSALLTW